MKTRRLQSPGLLSGFGIFHSSFCSRIEPPLLPRGLNPGLAFPCRQIVSLNRPLCRRRPLLPRSSFAVCVLECSSLQLSVHSMRKPSRPAQGLKSTLGLMALHRCLEGSVSVASWGVPLKSSPDCLLSAQESSPTLSSRCVVSFRLLVCTTP